MNASDLDGVTDAKGNPISHAHKKYFLDYGQELKEVHANAHTPQHV